VRKDGGEFPIELSVSRVDDDGMVTYTAILRDVSDRRHIEDLLRNERDFADSLIEAAHVIVLVLDPQGRIVRFNRHLEDVAGYRFDEMREQDWFEMFIPERDRARIQAIFQAVLGGTEVHGNVNPILTRQGDERTIQWYGKRLVDGDQQVLGVVSVGHDITERLLAEKRLHDLEHASRQRDRLADIGAITAKVVHDLGNPLAALSMQAQLILRRAKRKDFEPADLVEKPVEQMLDTLGRMEVLIREFTEFAREQRLDLTITPMRTYLSNVTEVWDAYAAARGVSLHTRVEPNLPDIQADPEMLRRVLDNLIKNAVDAIDEEEGEVVVSAHRCKDDKVCVEVSDSGCGIPEGLDVFRLFETTKKDGTGIGLAIATQIVSAHRGDILHEPRTPKGTVFKLELPIYGPQSG
jgi:PAS domain S-box-containing protein